MTLCVTFDALIKAESDGLDNYERANNGDGACESRHRGGGTKEGTQMAGELSIEHPGLALQRDDGIFRTLCIIFVSTQETLTRAPSPGLPPEHPASAANKYKIPAHYDAAAIETCSRAPLSQHWQFLQTNQYCLLRK